MAAGDPGAAFDLPAAWTRSAVRRVTSSSMTVKEPNTARSGGISVAFIHPPLA